MARAVATEHPEATVLLICAGSGGAFNLEDLYGAGYLVDRLTAHAPDRCDLTDAARAALGLYQRWSPEEALLGQTRTGQLFSAVGWDEEIRYAARAGWCSGGELPFHSQNRKQHRGFTLESALEQALHHRFLR